jgi:hypothetical protein
LKFLFGKGQRLNSRNTLRHWARQPVRQITNVIVRLVQRGFADDASDGHAQLSHARGAASSGCDSESTPPNERNALEKSGL